MNNPVEALEELKVTTIKYIETAFGTRSESLNEERRLLLERDGGLFQEPYIEAIPQYKSSQQLKDLPPLNGMSREAQHAFTQLACANLIQYPLYSHQKEMLEQSLKGKHCVVTSGTGSGKTESFLLPLIASIIKEAEQWSPTTPSNSTTYWNPDVKASPPQVHSWGIGLASEAPECAALP